MAALIAAVLGVGFLMYRRYRQRSTTANTVSKDTDEMFGDDAPFRVSVLSDDADCYDANNMNANAEKYNQNQTGTISSFDDDSGNDAVLPPKYAFDLSQSFKNDVMGTYGGVANSNRSPPTTMQVVAPYPILDETDDSVADSWAQTDGTVGSLEERLEEITAEI